MQQGSEHMAHGCNGMFCSADGDCGRQGYSDKGPLRSAFRGTE
jgi:hypothetical protein